MKLKDLPVLPQTPGVYIYRNSSNEIIYIGKAVNLSKRIKQYFQKDDAIGSKTKLLVSQISSLETIQTTSEFDALLLEAKLIYQNKPKYNVIAKDDKSPLYVQLTLQEELPRVQFVRKPKQASYGETYENGIVTFGPFQSAKTVRWILGNIRKVIPYCTQKIRNGKPCFYTHIGMCNPCASVLAKMPDSNEKRIRIKKYRHNIFLLRDVLSGKGIELRQKLEKQMFVCADNEQFEEAIQLRNQIQALVSLYEKRIDPMLYVQNSKQLEQNALEEQTSLLASLTRYYPFLRSLNRVECIDISNTQGSFATGSLVVFTQGIVDKHEYKRFKIKRDQVPNDFAMVAEVVKRRLNHMDWQYPDLLMIDGGKGQVQSAIAAANKFGFIQHPIAIIGLAKRREEIIIFDNGALKKLILPYRSPAIHFLQRIRDEAHRFALTYHRLLRKKAFKT